MAMAGNYESEEEQYEVERVISCRVATDGRISYLVRWKGYGMYEDTWEPEENLKNCKDAILKFFDDREVQPKKSEKFMILHLKEPSPVSPDFTPFFQNSYGKFQEDSRNHNDVSYVESQPRESYIKNLRLTPERRNRLSGNYDAQRGRSQTKAHQSTPRKSKDQVSRRILTKSDQKTTRRRRRSRSLSRKSRRSSNKKYSKTKSGDADQEISNKGKLKQICFSFFLIILLSIFLTGSLYAMLVYDLS